MADYVLIADNVTAVQFTRAARTLAVAVAQGSRTTEEAMLVSVAHKDYGIRGHYVTIAGAEVPVLEGMYLLTRGTAVDEVITAAEFAAKYEAAV